jgi:hypothetical protein
LAESETELQAELSALEDKFEAWATQEETSALLSSKPPMTGNRRVGLTKPKLAPGRGPRGSSVSNRITSKKQQDLLESQQSVDNENDVEDSAIVRKLKTIKAEIE